jgi:hypothetical protein
MASKGCSAGTKGRQKFQNKVAFTPNSYSTAYLSSIDFITQGVCKRCMEIIDWKKRLNKYKPLTQPKTCVNCHSRNVLEAYHVLCQKCALSKNTCAKCAFFYNTTGHVTNEIVNKVETRSQSEISKEKLNLQYLVSRLPERRRRLFLI